MPNYNHREAFCLMRYATDDRSVVELIWNSRDGVTPFMISTADGRRPMSHVDFSADRRDPWHVPKVGDRIFVDLTFERALERRRRYVERHWDDGEFPMRDHTHFGRMTKEEAARELAHADMRTGIDHMSPEELMAYGAGPPDVIVVTEDVLKQLEREREGREPPPYRPRKFA